MYSPRFIRLLGIHSNPMNRNSKGKKKKHAVTSKPSFSKVNAAWEPVNNLWLSVILTGIVFGLWNGAFNYFPPRKWGSYWKDQKVSRVILLSPVNFAVERDRGFWRSQKGQSHLSFRIQPRKEPKPSCHLSDDNLKNEQGIFGEVSHWRHLPLWSLLQASCNFQAFRFLHPSEMR